MLPAPEGFLGEVKNTTYTNAFFNFSFDFPKDWYRLDDAEIKAGINAGRDALKTEREKTNKAFEEAAQKEVVLIALAQGNLGSGKGANINVGVLKQPNSQVFAEQVIVLTKNFLLTNPKIKLVEDVQTFNLNGTRFSTITLETNANSLMFNQKLFNTMRKGYSVTFVLTYRDLEELKALEKIFESLKFNAK